MTGLNVLRYCLFCKFYLRTSILLLLLLVMIAITHEEKIRMEKV